MHLLSLRPPSKPPIATVKVPGSKSYTNRSLVMAAIAEGTTTLRSASLSSDSLALIAALEKLGVSVTTSNDVDGTALTVRGRGGDLTAYRGEIDVGPAGTTMRFLTALISSIPGADVVLKGSDRMHQRPIRELVDALCSLGAQIEYLGKEGCPPLRIRSTSALTGGPVALDGSVSSQFISAILLAAPRMQKGVTVEIVNDQTSKSYIDMTIQGIRDFGVAVTNEEYRRYTVGAAQNYAAREYPVECDLSGASYLWGIAALSGGSVTVENVNLSGAQGDLGFPYLLEQMGCNLKKGDRSLTITGTHDLRSIEADMENMPDTAQTLAVVASRATGPTLMRGLHTLRVKETDRIAALHAELAAVGVESFTTADTLTVTGGTPHSARIKTYDDHRMAMSFAMLGATIDGMSIEEPHVVEKSFPTFWKVLENLGITVTAHDR